MRMRVKEVFTEAIITEQKNRNLSTPTFKNGQVFSPTIEFYSNSKQRPNTYWHAHSCIEMNGK
jgi:hypothetical protein